MKIQCDVCNKDEAIMYCVADEAALCKACDHGVHHANKLAGKHQRFSLLQPSPKQAPFCDICQERRAFLFCQQDRAILCIECDISIHKANEHTQKHTRFLLTGVKLSATSTLYSSSSSSSPESSVNSDVVPSLIKPRNSTKKPVSVSVSPTIPYKSSATKTKTTTNSSIEPPMPAIATVINNTNNNNVGNGELMNNDSTSSISEYLMETLPGWHVDDFLGSSSQNGFFKIGDNDMQPFWGNDDIGKNLYSFSEESTNLWVPQVPPPHICSSTLAQMYPSGNISFGDQIGFKESKDAINFKLNKKRSDDDCFAVPQICPPSNAFKRSRNLW